MGSSAGRQVGTLPPGFRTLAEPRPREGSCRGSEMPPPKVIGEGPSWGPNASQRSRWEGKGRSGIWGEPDIGDAAAHRSFSQGFLPVPSFLTKYPVCGPPVKPTAPERGAPGVGAGRTQSLGSRAPHPAQGINSAPQFLGNEPLL